MVIITSEYIKQRKNRTIHAYMGVSVPREVCVSVYTSTSKFLYININTL